MEIPIITERLILREFSRDDLEAIHLYASDYEVVKYMEWGPNNESQTEDFLLERLHSQEEEPRKVFELAVIHKEEGHLIGACGLHIKDIKNKQAFIGYCFNKDFWGQGYATEAARALVSFGFKELNMHRIYATCDVENERSARVLEKTGMKREGHLREDKFQKNEWRDSYLYSILEQEWKQEYEQDRRKNETNKK